MTDDNLTDPLVDGAKIAVVHFGKAAMEVATGIGALLVGITETVKPASDNDEDASGPQTIEVE